VKATTESIAVGEFVSGNARATFDFGEGVGQQLSGGEILLLSGPLGAGKTMFVKGLACALGIDEAEVTSPSFTLVNLHQGRLLLYHIDLYRLGDGAAAAHAVDLDEIIADENAVVVIEWAERLDRYRLPANVWRVSISGDGDEPRKISISQDLRGNGSPAAQPNLI